MDDCRAIAHLARRRSSLCLAFMMLVCTLTTPLAAAQVPAGAPAVTDVAALRAELEQVRAEHARRMAELAADTDRRIAAIEARLVGAAAVVPGAPVAAAPATALAVPTGAAAHTGAAADRLQTGGDVRLRYENNSGADGLRGRNRGALRARLRASWAATDWLKIGAELATGDPDDPNSSDVTLSEFDDDLQVSLDQAYVQATLDTLVVTGGKFANPFLRTDLVWDGDVHPEGIALAWRPTLGANRPLRIAALYAPVDERASGPDSTLTGAQLRLEAPLGDGKRGELAIGWYDYDVDSLAGGDAGDFRSNRLASDGRHYASDFRLLDTLVTASFGAAGSHWPLRLTADYVRNLGTAGDDDTGWSIDLALGDTARAHGWRIAYGFAAAERDAVFAAFSHDNLDLATNYLQHALALDYAPAPNLLLNATLYHYRPWHAADLQPGDSLSWRNRLRLHFAVLF